MYPSPSFNSYQYYDSFVLAGYFSLALYFWPFEKKRIDRGPYLGWEWKTVFTLGNLGNAEF